MDTLKIFLLDCSFEVEGGEEFSVEFHGIDKSKFSVSEEGGMYELRQIKRNKAIGNWFLSFRESSGKVFMTVPREIKEITVDSGNGVAEVSSLSARNVHLRNGNGKIGLHNIKSETIDAKTGNGKITAENLWARTVTLRTNNGKIDGQQILAENSCSLETQNGSIGLQTQLPDNAGYRVLTRNGSAIVQQNENMLENHREGSPCYELSTSNGRAELHILTQE